MAKNWYALRCKPRKEEAVWRQVISHGIEAYYPRLRVRPVNPRSRKLVPYFPGYMFVYVDLEQAGISKFQWMPHTIGLVSFGGEPANVPDHFIPAIRIRLDEINAAGGEVFTNLKQGDKVIIHDGPFKGYEAVFNEKIPGSERVKVLLKFLGNRRQVSVILDAGLIDRKKK